MPNRIHEDWADFRDVISGRTRRELKRLIKSGQISRLRGKGGKMNITIPSIDIPHIVHGSNGGGIGRGPGKKGDVIGKNPQGQGNQGGGGDGSGEGITIQIDMADVLRFLKDELELPNMVPKPSQTYEDKKTVYTDISLTGPDSLRHTRRTLLEAIKRMSITNELTDLHYLPGNTTPIRLITPINSDRRYRQYREINIPSSNAVIFFARDCSASMNDYRCDIVSDMSWWIDCWIRQFYKKVERCYLLHDTECEEVDEKKFYEYRYGGGTKISPVFDTIADMMTHRYPPQKYNVYVFYFGDGDNQHGDNERVEKILQEKFKPHDLNLVGITQIMPYNYNSSLNAYLDEAVKNGRVNKKKIRLIDIKQNSGDGDGYDWSESMSEEERDRQIMEGIRQLLGKKKAIN